RVWATLYAIAPLGANLVRRQWHNGPARAGSEQAIRWRLLRQQPANRAGARSAARRFRPAAPRTSRRSIGLGVALSWTSATTRSAAGTTVTAATIIPPGSLKAAMATE